MLDRMEFYNAVTFTFQKMNSPPPPVSFCDVIAYSILQGK